MRILCFDIGGTAIKYSLIENISNYRVYEIETRKNDTTNYILDDVLNIIDKYKDLDAVAISTAGVVDSQIGEVIYAGPTIPNYTGTKFKKIIEERFNILCEVENDVNSAAYGEYIYSKENGIIFCLTLGTGVGGAIINEGSIIKGRSMTAGEIGYMPLNNGYFQEFASTSYLVKKASNLLGEKVDGKYIFEKAKQGDKQLENVINEMVENLSIGLLNIIYILNPNKIIIGGAVTKQGDYLQNKIENAINKKLIDSKFKTDIEFAKLKNDAGLYGIYYITKQKLEGK